VEKFKVDTLNLHTLDCHQAEVQTFSIPISLNCPKQCCNKIETGSHLPMKFEALNSLNPPRGIKYSTLNSSFFNQIIKNSE
jgi:hypothetical protein